MAKGRILIEDLVKAEHDETRRFVKQEAQTTKDMVTNNISLFLSSAKETEVSHKKREDLLQSLKFPEMNERLNGVVDPQDATFKRVFRSFEEISGDDIFGGESTGWEIGEDDNQRNSGLFHQIDQAWATLVHWLTSNESLFWIRGKPGSGKSTLLKFILSHQNTHKLLSRWNTDVQLIPHFFWKPGCAPQNSAKGMLSSLIYSILQRHPGISDHLLKTFTELSRKSFYNDWSARELETVLFSILETPCPPICLFIDGLDEISDNEGPDKVLDLITKFQKYDHVKSCVSSRPENPLSERLAAMSAANIRLEELTAPDMHIYARGQLNLASSNDEIKPAMMMQLAHELVDRAEGIFLWLFLATRSVISGIRQKDHVDEIYSRLQQLPSDIDKLYQGMWQRLNYNEPIYRVPAAKYFNMLLYRRITRYLYHFYPNGSLPPISVGPVLADFAFLHLKGKQMMAVTTSENFSHADIQKLCERTVDDIHYRCAGLIEVKETAPEWQERFPAGRHSSPLSCIMMQRVQFIHRSAYDFLVDTTFGQKIRSHDRSSPDELGHDFLRAAISAVPVLTKEHGGFVDIKAILRRLNSLLGEASPERRQTMLDILPVVRELYERGSLACIGRHAQVFPSPSMRTPFLLLVAAHEEMEDYVISSLNQESPVGINAALYGACAGERATLEHLGNPVYRIPWRLVNTALSLGANPHTFWTFIYADEDFHTKESSAFSILLERAINPTERDIEDIFLARTLQDTATSMASTCSESRQKFLLSVYGGTDINVSSFCYALDIFDFNFPGFIVEVDLRFMLKQVFALYSTGIKAESCGNLQRLDPAKWSTSDSVIVRLMVSKEAEKPLMAVKPLDQNPFKVIMDSFFSAYTSNKGAFKDDSSICDPIHPRINELMNNPCAVEEVDLKFELLEGIVGMRKPVG
jgi:hypothetical protein